jgi:hypothetical protein
VIEEVHVQQKRRAQSAILNSSINGLILGHKIINVGIVKVAVFPHKIARKRSEKVHVRTQQKCLRKNENPAQRAELSQNICVVA